MMESGQLTLSARTLDRRGRADYVDCTNDSSALVAFSSHANMSAVLEPTGYEGAIRALASKGVYLMGPLLNRLDFFTEATSVTVIHANSAVDEAVSKRSVRIAQTAVNVRRKADQSYGVQDKSV
jgi:hypothetical protein